ncbi:MATE family efflux transporter [Marinimicrobium alkaliphilum]|uniref:MATE family efflux transporter n=1 Tax=Marinimicrobium alkaliphilum TaxID=2202654 RepID=UPI000DB918CC|nr:MATE family efflux transporter [Marinimicrobium alkaliphilum]
MNPYPHPQDRWQVRHRRIWQLAWPLILSNLSVPLLGVVDTAILGHLPEARYLGAVAVGASILSLLFWSFGFLRMGTTSLVARACGRDDGDASRLLLAQGMVLALLISAVLLALQGWLLPLALHLMNPGNEVATLAHSYLALRLHSAPATLATYVLIGWFIGQQDTRSPLLILVVTNLLNIVLDIVLIIGLGLNSDGAALASVLAEYAGLALGLWVLRTKLKGISGRLDTGLLRHWRSYLPLLDVNRHLFVRTLCLLGAFAFFTAQGARQGELILAANAILLQLVMLSAHGLDGFAHAAEALTGKAIGARRLHQFLLACRDTTAWALAVALLMVLIYAAGAPWLPGLFTGQPEVLERVHRYYLWVCLLPLVAVWAYQLDGVFLGSGHTHAMQYTVIAAAIGVFLPLWWLTQHWGNHGLWLAFVAFNGARGLFLGGWFIALTRYRRWL